MAKRGRKLRPASPVDGDRPVATGRQRRIYRQGNSWVLGVPIWARRTLGCVSGGLAYWHDTGADAVLLSNSPTHTKGHAIVSEMERELGRLRRANARLLQRVQARPIKALHEGKSAGYMVALKQYVRLDGDVQAVAERLDRIEDLLERALFRLRAPASPDPSPSAPPSPVVSEGEAGTAGPSVPGAP